MYELNEDFVELYCNCCFQKCLIFMKLFPRNCDESCSILGGILSLNYRKKWSFVFSLCKCIWVICEILVISQKENNEKNKRTTRNNYVNSEKRIWCVSVRRGFHATLQINVDACGVNWGNWVETITHLGCSHGPHWMTWRLIFGPQGLSLTRDPGNVQYFADYCFAPAALLLTVYWWCFRWRTSRVALFKWKRKGLIGLQNLL